MKKSSGTTAEPLAEIADLKRRIKKLERSEAELQQAESQRQAALAALREGEERFRTLYENAALGIYRTTPQGRVLLANPALVRMLGYSSFAELATRDLETDGFEPSYPRTRFIEMIEKDGTIKGLESAWARKDGTIIFIRENATAIRDARGRILYYDGTVEDITERKRAEAQRESALTALRESEERQQLILATLPIAIFTSPLDPEMDASWISGDVEKVTGYTVEQYMAVKDFWRTRLHPGDRERVLAAYRDRAAGDEIVLEYRWLCRDGNYKWFHDRTIRKRTRQGLQYFGIILDISERKRAEEENRVLQARLQWAEKMEAIGTLAGGLAHDFNNLLSGIQGHASLAKMNLDPADPNQERLNQIDEQVQSGVALTSQLLGFARGGRYEVKPTDMNEIIERTSAMFGRTRKEIAIRRKLDRSLWSVEVDRGQMEQVLLNLYVNAWQAMPGGGDIYLETENASLQNEKELPYSVKPGNYVKITVTDTGCGMEEKVRLRVFDPFFTTKEMGRGTGLGLASVYGIIKGHQGMINVYSEPGHGATFTIHLPASGKAAPKEKPAAGNVARGTETILLVDDEKVVLDVNQELLAASGYTVHAAGSGREALAIYQEKRDTIDLVILDMVMPGISGSETFDRLRQIAPAVKVLLSSGYSLSGEAQQIMDRGCNGFLQKPFQIEKLSRKIRELLDKQPALQATGVEPGRR
jgi:PAS domain S-box-containing protein